MTDDTDLRRAFLAACSRLAEATSFDVQCDEVGNMLGHLNRLIQFKGYEKRIAKEPSTPMARRVLVFRHKNEHDLVTPAAAGDAFPDTFTELSGVLEWVESDELLKDSRYERYKVVDIIGRPVIDTFAEAFEEVYALPKLPRAEPKPKTHLFRLIELEAGYPETRVIECVRCSWKSDPMLGLEDQAVPVCRSS